MIEHENMAQPSVLEDTLNRLDMHILGNPTEVRLSLACLLSRGHLLLEDVPGVGKTTLAQALARELGLDHHRIQFTGDLMPSEITGGTIFERNSDSFVFHKGPIFTQVVIADEINRATPRTQSALLEAMSERAVSVEGITHRLDDLFTVIATQNPVHQTGTYPLPESQLDRFSMCLSLGYPDSGFEKQLLAKGPAPVSFQTNNDIDLAELQRQVSEIHCSDELIQYLHRLITATRVEPSIELGVSPRGGLQWLAIARAWAFIEGRDHVLPDDLQAIALPAIAHKCVPVAGSTEPIQQVLRRLVTQVSVYG